VVKARRIILEGVRDHIVLNLHKKETLFTMLFENNSDHKKLPFKENI